MINVTKTFLPPQDEYQAILKRAWDNKSTLSNRFKEKTLYCLASLVVSFSWSDYC